MNRVNRQLFSIEQKLIAADEVPTQPQADRFHRLLLGVLSAPSSPQEMLTRQMDTMGLTVGVDLCAKLSGSVSQSINKLVNMT